MSHRRTGKIARLPANIREQVNEKLDDGLEYNRIIDWLTEQGFSGVSQKNMSKWKEGGFQDWLTHCQRLDELELKLQFAAELAEKADAVRFQQAAMNLTCLQFFELLNRFEGSALVTSLYSKPEKYPALINSLARFTKEYVGLERFRDYRSDKAKAEADRNRINEEGLDGEGVARILRALRIRYPREFLTEVSTDLPPKSTSEPAATNGNQLTPMDTNSN